MMHSAPNHSHFWDYLNRDLHKCVACHILATYGMDKELMVEFDSKQIPHRFSGATPEHLEQAF